MGVNQRPIASRLRTLVLSSFAYLVVPLSALMTGPLLARSLGPEGRGLMAALLAPLALANVLFTFGVPDALT
jgi:O-antigen/teichoic acid export membrane protein